MTNGYTSIGSWQCFPNSQVNMGVWQGKWLPVTLASVNVSMIALFTFLMSEVLSLVVSVSQTVKLLGAVSEGTKLNTTSSSAVLFDGIITGLPER